MKKVITGERLYNYEEEAIELLCGTVKKTLGPKGSNAIIDHSMFSPFITNDGVTIAKNIESEDECINTILTLAKEASIKTNEEVGDGTTTTLVLLESIFKSGIKKIREGLNPNILKKELDEATKEVIEELKKESKDPEEKDYLNIASIAANDEKIGKEISSLYLRLQQKGAIKIEESETNKTDTEIIKGYTFETFLASPYFLNSKEEQTFKKPYLLLVNKEILEIEEISEVINFIIDKKVPIVTIAKDYSEEVVNEILSLNFNKVTNVILLKMPEYGLHQIEVLNDIEILTNAKLIKTNDEINLNNLAKCDEIKIDKKEVTIINSKQKEKVEKRIKELEEKLIKEKDSYEKDFLNERLAKLTNGKGIIRVGGVTITEARERKMRYDDALCALKSMNEGVLPGAGMSLLKIHDQIQVKSNGYALLKDALNQPFIEILKNAGIDDKKIYNEIKANDYSIIYNTLEEKFEFIKETKIIDPTNVVINTLKNASSIASMLLTTTSLIINEYKEDNKINLNSEL